MKVLPLMGQNAPSHNLSYSFLGPQGVIGLNTCLVPCSSCSVERMFSPFSVEKPLSYFKVVLIVCVSLLIR